MQHHLRLTPFYDCFQMQVDVSYRVNQHKLTVEFHLVATDTFDWHPLQHRQRKDYLWESTCLELFLQPVTNTHKIGQISAEQSAYVELNVSPDGSWNVYHFDQYRHPNSIPPRHLDATADDIQLIITDSNDRLSMPKETQSRTMVSRTVSLDLGKLYQRMHLTNPKMLQDHSVLEWCCNITCVMTDTNRVGDAKKTREDFFASRHAQHADFHDTTTWFDLLN